MGGRSSFQIAKVFGIRIGVNASWFLVLFLFIFLLSDPFSRALNGDQTTAYFVAVAAALLFFSSIVLHELGHALAARRCGIEVRGIDLFFFGGLMKTSRDSESPGTEFKVAIAGPLVTLLIVIVSASVGILVSGGIDNFWNAALIRSSTSGEAVNLVLAFLVTMNALLLIFNLIPAYPLDGGRVARSIAWKITNDRNRGTRFAARIGQGFSYFLIGVGLLIGLNGDYINGIWLAVLGWMLGQSARSAVLHTSVVERLQGITVADIMDNEPVAIPSDLDVTEAYETFFLRYHDWKWFPVIDASGLYAGILHRKVVEDASYEAKSQNLDRKVCDLLGTGSPGEGRVALDTSLDALLGSEALRRLGGVIAIDAAGRLAGVVTVDQVSRALQTRLVAN